MALRRINQTLKIWTSFVKAFSTSCRRARTLPDQIKELKAELPPKDSEGKRPPSPQLEQEIAELEKASS